MSVIRVRGAGEHNLKNINLEIPKQKLVAFTGISGSGKSSLVFDTLYMESFRRFATAGHSPLMLLGRSMMNKMERPKFESISGLPPTLGLSQKQGVAGKLSTVGTITGISDLFRVLFAAFGLAFCKNCNVPLNAQKDFEILATIEKKFADQKIFLVAPIAIKRKGSFAKEIENFRKLGFARLKVNDEIVVLDEQASFKIDPKKLNNIDVYVDTLKVDLSKSGRLNRGVSQALEIGKGILKVEDSSFQVKAIFNAKSGCPLCGEAAPKLDPRYFSHASLGQCLECHGTGSSGSDLPADVFPCSQCQGSRLSVELPKVTFFSHSFTKLHFMRAPELENILKTNLLPFVQEDKSQVQILEEILRLVSSMQKLNLGHLPLYREAQGLSPGDLQRLRLVSMISNRLKGVMYVLDEPCQGLTANEVKNLVEVLRELIRENASVLAVEHHPVFLDLCDEVFVLGPGAGAKGGEVIGRIVGETEKNYFSGVQSIVPKKSIGGKQKKHAERNAVQFENFKLRNLKIKKSEIYERCINLIRGPSGSGKSTYVEWCLKPGLEQFLESELTQLQTPTFKASKIGNPKISQIHEVSPGSLARSSRRSVAAAIDMIAPLRVLFSQLNQSQILGLSEMHFSFHSKLGRCSTCEGRGFIELVQRFGPPVKVLCESCLGAKLSPRSLLPRYRGMNFADILNLSIEEAVLLFSHIKSIERQLSVAMEFGLGYVKIGQNLDSLSGGELQRLTLCLELKRSQLEGHWFLLYHPCTGLHGPDISVLVQLLTRMVAAGASFVVIENREEFLPFCENIFEISDHCESI